MSTAEYDALDALLQQWGAWQEKHCEDGVLPKQAAFCAIVSDQPAGSRILCAEMSNRVYHLNRILLTLEVRHRQVLFVWYAIQLKAAGGFWSVEEKAALFGCSSNALRLRVGRARRETMLTLLREVAWLLQAEALPRRQFHDTSVLA